MVLVAIVVTVLLIKLGVGQAAASLLVVLADSWLTQVGQKLGGFRIKQAISVNLLEWVDQVGATIVVLKLDNVRTIGAVGTLTGLVGSVGIRASPLEVNVVTTSNMQVVWNEVIFDGRESLDDVTTATTDVQVEDTSSTADAGRAWLDPEGVRAIFEGTAVLVSVKSQGKVAKLAVLIKSERNLGVVLNWRLLAVISVVNHLAAIINMTPSWIVTRGDVVAETEDAGSTLELVRNLRVIPSWLGDSPQVTGSGSTIVSVTQVVVAGQRMRNAFRVWEIPAWNFLPVPLVGFAIPFVVSDSAVTPDRWDCGWLSEVEGSVSVGTDAVALRSLVLRVSMVVWAALGEWSRGQDSNILPWGWVPVWVVVTLLIAFPATATTIVLASINSSVTDILVGNEQALVAFTAVAVTPEVGWFVLNIVAVVIVIIRRSLIVGTITNPWAAHVLQNDFAISVWMVSTAAVLGGPFDLEKGALVVSHFRTPAVASGSVVLRVEGTVLVVGVTTITVVRAARIVQIDICKA